MQVGNSCKLFGSEAPIESIQSFQAMVFPLEVCLHEVDIGGKVGKEWTRKSTTKHRKPYIRILMGKRIDHGYYHSHIAKG